jgi:uncharacterized protein YecT (DUF1311 family)
MIPLLFLVAATLKPPTILEQFTPLPCPRHPVTTLDLEGCAERAVLATDRAVDAQVRTIFHLLPAKARGSFVDGELLWQRYRLSSCRAAAGYYAGGTLAPVVFANCLADRNRTHLVDLRSMRKRA